MWYNRASSCISPSRFGDFSRDHYRCVTDWLRDPANGKWILVFDDVSPELDYGDILPGEVSWGKIILTSRTEFINVGTKGLSERVDPVPMPPLSEAESWKLFAAQNGRARLTHNHESEVSNFCSSVGHRPFAIILASAHFQTFRTFSDLYPTIDNVPGDYTDVVQNCISLLIEDSRMDERMLLKFFVMIGRGTASLDIVNLCQRSRRRRRDLAAATEFLATRCASPAIQHWASVGLLQRQTSPSGPVVAISSSAEAVVRQGLSNDIEQSGSLLTTILLLLTVAQDEVSALSTETSGRNFERSVSSVQNLCLTAADMSIDVPDDVEKYLQLVALHYLGKTIDEGRRLAKRLFWRQWLSSFQYPPPAYIHDKKEALFGVPPSIWPIWLETQSHHDRCRSTLDHRHVVSGAVIAKLCDALKLAIMLSGMGRAWHGIREHVFDFARQNFHSDFTESQKANFIDFLDKGGAEGLQATLQTVLHANEFQQEASEMLHSDVTDSIVEAVHSLSDLHISSLSEDVVRQAVNKALDDTMSEMFAEASSAMTEALYPIQDLITSVIQGALEVPSDGQGARELVRFVISSAGSQNIWQCCHIMTKGFCEYLDIAKVWIASKCCLHLAHAALNELGPRCKIDWDWICNIIELVREGVMPVEVIRGRMAEVAGRRMHYWVEEACKCRTAWGARPKVPEYNFRNQGQWEENSVLMGTDSGTWILS